eukprot:scaffold309958_cov32-Tisochrysis_lutea.AAC.1
MEQQAPNPSTVLELIVIDSKTVVIVSAMELAPTAPLSLPSHNSHDALTGPPQGVEPKSRS